MNKCSVVVFSAIVLYIPFLLFIYNEGKSIGVFSFTVVCFNTNSGHGNTVCLILVYMTYFEYECLDWQIDTKHEHVRLTLYKLE